MASKVPSVDVLEFTFVNNAFRLVRGSDQGLTFAQWCKLYGLDFDPTISLVRGSTADFKYSIHFNCYNIVVKRYF